MFGAAVGDDVLLDLSCDTGETFSFSASAGCVLTVVNIPENSIFWAIRGVAVWKLRLGVFLDAPRKVLGRIVRETGAVFGARGWPLLRARFAG